MSICNALTYCGTNCKNSGTHDGKCRYHIKSECGICLDTVRQRSMTRLECGHRFCMECIYSWLCEKNTYSVTCPMCRQIIVSNHYYTNSLIWGLEKGIMYVPTLCQLNLKGLEESERLTFNLLLSIPHNVLISPTQFDLIANSCGSEYIHEIFQRLLTNSTDEGMVLKVNHQLGNPLKFYMFVN